MELTSVSKRFAGVQALREIDLRIERGAVHAIVGENGAGKSTLGRVLVGAVRPDAGQIRVAGQAVSFRSPHDALVAGITGIAQELALLPARSVLDNVFLGVESRRRFGRVDKAGMSRRFADLADQVGLQIPSRALVRDLSLADRQKVEIMRALARKADLVVFDEPTAALSVDETALLLDTVRRLAATGTTVVFISHFLKEVLAVGDRVTILKDGAHVRTVRTSEESEASLVEGMLGRSLERMFPARPPRPREQRAALEVDRISTRTGIDGVSLRIASGEIVGLAGLVGSGRSELLHAIHSGAGVTSGAVAVDGSPRRIRSPRDGKRSGIALLPESRKDQGLLMERSASENVVLGQLAGIARWGVVRKRSERAVARGLVERLGLAGGRISSPVGTLSGGNQQKVLLARCLLDRPAVLLADEPTRGVDVGAKHSIYELLISLAAEGAAVLFASSEIEEILELPHRALVLREGRIEAELEEGAISEDAVMRVALGASPRGGDVG
ncbi:MAG: hypothetical protein BGO11_11610 [Solirubrobacterales bacterium 70-9]|nr:MAG: hypothetical protein BGO11_11610 [Solirubrobacterales bacterium 70-9]